jgi:hypothetical protein
VEGFGNLHKETLLLPRKRYENCLNVYRPNVIINLIAPFL